MELSSFETVAFSQRQTEKAEELKRAWPRVVRSQIPRLVGLCVSGVLFLYVVGKVLSFSIFDNLVTPNRLLILITVCLILITPIVKGRNRSSFPPSVLKPAGETKPIAPMTSANLPNGISYSPGVGHTSFERPFPTPLFSQSTPAVPTRYDPGMAAAGRRSMHELASHLPAPYLDDIHSVQRHEFSDVLPLWARMFEERVVLPIIVIPFMRALEESDMQLSQYLGQFGYKLSSTYREEEKTLDDGSSKLYLSDRFLPNPLSSSSEISALWSRRQNLESVLSIPNFSHKYREHVVSRIRTWASRNGIRFSYRPDMRADNDIRCPSDSHILSNLIFSSIDSKMGHGKDTPFRDKFVLDQTFSIENNSTRYYDSEFNAVFGAAAYALGSARAAGHKTIWLEQYGNASSVVQYNVATNHKVYGVQPGIGNILESLCLFFHLLKKLGGSIWVTIPTDIRMALDSLLVLNGIAPGNDHDLTGGLLNFGNSIPNRIPTTDAAALEY